MEATIATMENCHTMENCRTKSEFDECQKSLRGSSKHNYSARAKHIVACLTCLSTSSSTPGGGRRENMEAFNDQYAKSEAELLEETGEKMPAKGRLVQDYAIEEMECRFSSGLFTGGDDGKEVVVEDDMYQLFAPVFNEIKTANPTNLPLKTLIQNTKEKIKDKYHLRVETFNLLDPSVNLPATIVQAPVQAPVQVPAQVPARVPAVHHSVTHNMPDQSFGTMMGNMPRMMASMPGNVNVTFQQVGVMMNGSEATYNAGPPAVTLDTIEALIREQGELLREQGDHTRQTLNQQPKQVAAAISGMVTNTIEDSVIKALRQNRRSSPGAGGENLGSAFAQADSLFKSNRADKSETWYTLLQKHEEGKTRSQQLDCFLDNGFEIPTETIIHQENLHHLELNLASLLTTIGTEVIRTTDDCMMMLYDTSLPDVPTLSTICIERGKAAGKQEHEIDHYEYVNEIKGTYAAALFPKNFDLEVEVVRDGEEHTVEFVVMATGDNCATPTITTVLEIFGRSEEVSKFDLDSPSSEGRPFFKGNLEFLKNMSRTLHQQGQVKVVTFRKFRFTVEQHKDLQALKGLNVRFPECVFDDDNTPIPEDIEEYAPEEYKTQDGKTQEDDSPPSTPNRRGGSVQVAQVEPSAHETPEYDTTCWSRYMEVDETKRKCLLCDVMIDIAVTPCPLCKCICMPDNRRLDCEECNQKNKTQESAAAAPETPLLGSDKVATSIQPSAAFTGANGSVSSSSDGPTFSFGFTGNEVETTNQPSSAFTKVDGSTFSFGFTGNEVETTNQPSSAFTKADGSTFSFGFTGNEVETTSPLRRGFDERAFQPVSRLCHSRQSLCRGFSTKRCGLGGRRRRSRDGVEDR
jgi:hypothetical protein